MPSTAKPSVALLGVPWDGGSSFLRGSASAPPAIRQALASAATSLATENGLDLAEPGRLIDLGDLSLPDEAAHGTIERRIAEVEAGADRLIVLGGDHSITYPVVRGLATGKSLTILHFDAHPDLYEEFEGDRLSHACPFARILEEGLCRRLVQVGLRNANRHQREQAARYGVEQLFMADLDPPPALVFDGPVYLSFDLDVIDPAFAPGVSHHEPGGLSTRQVLSLLSAWAPPLVAADVVELNPERDPAGITAALAAKLVKEIASVMLAPVRSPSRARWPSPSSEARAPRLSKPSQL